MAINRQRQKVSYGLTQPLIGTPPEPIISNRAPTTGDKAEIGTDWIDKTNTISYKLIKIAANSATWYPTTTVGVDVIAVSFTATTGDITATAGDIVATAGDVVVTAGDIIVTAGAIDTVGAAGDITAALGDIIATDGDIIATDGDVVVTAGNIEVTAGDITVALGEIAATAGDIRTATGDLVSARSVFVGGDEGTGFAGFVTLTNVVDTTLSTGAGKVLMKTANPGDSSGWLKIYEGTNLRYVPYWTTLSP